MDSVIPVLKVSGDQGSNIQKKKKQQNRRFYLCRVGVIKISWCGLGMHSWSTLATSQMLSRCSKAACAS
jgi:hypothetical protein